MTDRNTARRRVSLLLAIAFVYGVIQLMWLESPPSEDPLAQAKPSAMQQHAPSDKPIVRIDEKYGQREIYFEENRGQTDKKVRFLSKGTGYQFFITEEEAVFVLKKAQDTAKKGDERADRRRPDREKRRYDVAVLRMRFEGANRTPRVSGEEMARSKSNYFLGNDPEKWCRDVPNFRKVRCEGVYEGVDVVYYGNQRQLEYDFVVAPGADTNQIALAFEGAEKIEIAENGDLILHAANGIVRQKAPLIYQEEDGKRHRVGGKYVKRADDRVEFEVADYDRARPLVIDPILFYSTYLGGDSMDYGRGIAVDGGGHAYVTGYCDSNDFPVKDYYQSNQSNADAFVSKFDPSGSLVYSTYLGGDQYDMGHGIDVDGSGNAYIVGETTSDFFPTTAAPFQSSRYGSTDGFVTKLSSGGNSLVYSTYFGGSDWDYVYGVAVDGSGHAYICGETGSGNDFPVQSPLNAYNGNGDGFISKLSSDGQSLVYSTYHGGTQSDGAYNVDVDSSGNAYVVGTTYSTMIPVVNALQSTNAGEDDAWVAKLNSEGSGYVYSTYLGGSSWDYGNDIAVTNAGEACVVGATDSTNFPVLNALYPQNAGSRDAYLCKIKADGSGFVYSTYYGGSNGEYGYNWDRFGVAVDGAGNAYIAGFTDSSDLPMVDPIYGTIATTPDAFVAKFSSAGETLFWSTYLGGNGSDYASSIGVDNAGNAYVTGKTYSSDFPLNNAYQSTLGGGAGSMEDAFVAKIQGPKPPFIDFLDTTGGPTAGGTRVVINGGGFVFDSTVTFGGTAATNLNVISDTQLECTTPAGAAGKVDVVVANPDGQSATLVEGYTYVDGNNRAPEITSGPHSSDSSPFIGDTVNYTVDAKDADGDTLTFLWKFGDGTTSDEQNPSHVFSVHGTFTVTVTVSDGVLSVSASLTQIVYHPTLPNITEGPTANPNPAVVGNNVMLNAQASNAAGDTMTYTWDFGDGSATQQGPAVLHAFAVKGEYTVTVTVSDPSGNSTSGSVIVEVTDPGGGGTPTGQIGITKIKLKLNFKKANRDLLAVQGVILIPDGFNPDGMAVDVDASGVFGSFVLDAKGKAKTDANGDKNKKFMLKLKIKKGVVQAGECKFTMTFKKGDFQDTWRRFGLEDADITGRNVSIPMTVAFPTMIYPDFLAGDYKARKGRSGSYQAKDVGLKLGG